MHFDIHGNPIFLMSADGEGDSSALADAQAVFDAKLKDFEIEKQKAEKLKEINSLIGDQLEAAKDQLRVDDIRLRNLGDFIEQNKKNIDVLLESGKLMGEMTTQFGLSEKQANKLFESIKNSEDKADALARAISEMRTDLALSTQFAGQLNSGFSKLSKSMGLAADASKTMFGGFAKGLAGIFQGDRQKNLKSLGAGILGLFSPLNILSSSLEKSFNLFVEMDKAAVDMRISTGKALGDIQEQINTVSASTAQFGIKLDKVTAALKNINTEITGGGLESYKLSLAESATLMEKFGILSSQTAKNQQLLLKTFKGISATDVNMILEDIAASADAVGKTSSAMAADFSGAMEYLVVDGKKAIEIFKNLEIQAAETGLAVTEFINLGKKFDTFAAGAKTAATFNAVLGTSMSSIALMSMDTAERMEVLRNEINNATGGFDNMTRSQRLFAASALGMSEAKTAQFLKADTAEMKRREAVMKAQKNIQDKLTEAMENLLPVMERVSMAFEKFVRENPDAIESVANAVLNLVEVGVRLIENAKMIAFVFGGLMITIARYKTALAAQAVAEHGVAVASRASAIASGLKTMFLGAETTTLEGAALAQHKYNLAAARGAIRVMLVVGALMALYAIFHKRGSPMLYMMPLVMAGFIIIMSRALESMSGMAMLGALALAVLAGSVALVFYGMAAFTESLTGFFETLIGSIDMIPVLAFAMFGLGAAFMFLGTSAALSAVGLFMGIGALATILAIFKLAGVEADKVIVGAGEEILKIGTGIKAFSDGLGAMASSIAAIKQAMGDDGLLAATLQGDKSSVVMGKNVAVANLFRNNTLTVDVKMPEIAMPETVVNVYIGNEEIKDIIRKEIRSNA